MATGYVYTWIGEPYREYWNVADGILSYWQEGTVKVFSRVIRKKRKRFQMKCTEWTLERDVILMSFWLQVTETSLSQRDCLLEETQESLPETK